MASNIRNFDLTVDEIRLIRSIKDVSAALDSLMLRDPDSDRARYMYRQIDLLQTKLEELQQRSLIR